MRVLSAVLYHANWHVGTCILRHCYSEPDRYADNRIRLIPLLQQTKEMRRNTLPPSYLKTIGDQYPSRVSAVTLSHAYGHPLRVPSRPLDALTKYYSSACKFIPSRVTYEVKKWI